MYCEYIPRQRLPLSSRWCRSCRRLRGRRWRQTWRWASRCRTPDGVMASISSARVTPFSRARPRWYGSRSGCPPARAVPVMRLRSPRGTARVGSRRREVHVGQCGELRGDVAEGVAAASDLPGLIGHGRCFSARAAQSRLVLLYSWSVTCAPQVVPVPGSSPVSNMARCSMKSSGVAPCQCSSPGGV
jgi:hypothetical protein